MWSGLALGAALPVIGGEPAAAQNKMAKTLVKYQPTPNNAKDCSQCKFFIKPNSCQLVAGDISPDGWCQLWIKTT